MPGFRARASTFDHADGWYAIGLQILQATGWRPDALVAHSENLHKVVPPSGKIGEKIVIRSPKSTQWFKRTDMTESNKEGRDP